MKQTTKDVEKLITTIKSEMTSVFEPQTLDHLAKETGFIIRSTNRICAVDFVQLLSLEMLENPMMSAQGMCDILAQLSPECQISPQALQQRLVSPGAADFLAEVFETTLTAGLAGVFQQTPPALLAPFGRVWLQDSTQCQLSAKLAKAFRGAGGSASQSALKLSLIYEHHNQQIHQVIFTDGVTSETTVGNELLSLLNESDLVIRDLGYLILKSIKEITRQSAFYLSRFTKGIPVYLTPQLTASPIDLPSDLDKTFKTDSVIDIEVYLGKERLPSRLIAYRAPEEVVNQRRRQAYNTARKKGRKPSAEYLRWLAFTFYITNVSPWIWTPKVVGTIYRLRWQIELIFKQWKSYLGIQCLKGTNENRIRCLIYGRLIAIGLMAMIYRSLCCYAFVVSQREPSAFKLINWLLRRRRLVQAVQNGQLDELFNQMIQAAPRELFKQRRIRRTTQELIAQQVGFFHGF